MQGSVCPRDRSVCAFVIVSSFLRLVTLRHQILASRVGVGKKEGIVLMLLISSSSCIVLALMQRSHMHAIIQP